MPMSSVVSKLNPRERAMVTVIGVLLVGGGLVFAGVQGYNKIDSLDLEIDRLEQELLNLAQQNAQQGAVETAYREVVAEHSSDLSKEEIHDNLRREIFRASKTTVKGKDGKPDRERNLVKIPTLREGILKEESEGYREYQIRFRIPQARLRDLVRFVQRIETSNQILRIDSLDLTRAPQAKLVEASIVITRIVLDTPGYEGAGRGSARAPRAAGTGGHL